jgi:hypothetical protein
MEKIFRVANQIYGRSPLTCIELRCKPAFFLMALVNIGFDYISTPEKCQFAEMAGGMTG